MEGTKIEIKNLCPMIAMISAGKTSILKVLFDVDFLEASAGIGTKFVNIIRYNPDVGKNPKFYHLKLKDIGNGDYDYYKDPDFKEIIGKQEIKQSNEKINQELKNKTVPYEELFYMIEVGESSFIEDKEYLKNYDLVDIPGVSEFNVDQTPEEKPTEDISIFKEDPEDLGAAYSAFEGENNKSIAHFDTIEKEMENYDPSKEKSYLTEIFRIIKNKMTNGIIVFSIDNYQHVENYRIIGKLHKVIKKPIENFLIFLNKIDKSENKEFDLGVLNSKIMKFFPSGTYFNFTKNIIVPLSTIQLENESKMSKDFKYFLYYHYINYLMNTQTDTPTLKGSTTTGGLNFIDFLKKINKRKKISKKKFVEIINKMVESENYKKILGEIKGIISFIKERHSDDDLNLGVRADDFEEKQIKGIIDDKLQIEEDNEGEEDGDEQNDGFDINEQDGVIFILFFYNEFKNNKKQIPSLSKNTLTIKRFFSMKSVNDDKKKIDMKELLTKLSKEDIKKQNLSQKIDDISKRLIEFYEEYKKENVRQQNLDKLQKSINSSIGILKTSNYLYIPMLGVSNAGKSTILNGLIGCSILPAHKNECTKKGILIKHWDNEFPAIRKTKFKKDNLGDEIIYYFEPEANIIARGIHDIHRVLEGTNGEFTDNAEDYFYQIDINIKFVRELNMDENIKNKICFIDLPGFGTNNAFEQNEIYSRLIKSCNIFLFIVFNLKIKEVDNKKMLDNLIEKMKSFRGIVSHSFIEKCLFIVNCDKDQEISAKTEEQAKNDIISVVQKEKNKNPNNNIVPKSSISKQNIYVSFFNAKFYENYIHKLIYYNSPSLLIEQEYQEFLDSVEKVWQGLLDKVKGGTFNNYLISVLEDNIKKDIKESFNKDIVKQKEEIEIQVRETLKYMNFKDKDINLISKLITYGSDNINKSELITKSNIRIFSTMLLLSIEKAQKAEEKEINKNLKTCFKILDDVFEVAPNVKFGPCKDAPITKVVKPHVEEDLNTMTTEVDDLIKSINSEFDKYNIVSLLDSYSAKINKILIDKKEQISEELQNKKWKKVQEDFEEAFKKESGELKSQLLSYVESASENIKTYYDQCYDKLDQFYSESCERPCILFKDHIANSLGGNNNIEETLQELIDDIVVNSKSAASWDNVKGFFKWVRCKFSSVEYLTKIIDFIINKTNTKFTSFRNNIAEYVDTYKNNMNNEIKSSKDRVVAELEEKKEKEKIEINLANAQNEEERKKWEEEKRILEENKKRWEELCRKYRALRDEITSLRLGGE